MHVSETVDFEREFAELVRELRAVRTAAPPELRARVRNLGEPDARRGIPTLPWRRSLLVLAPACMLALAIAAVVHGVVNSGSSGTAVVVTATTPSAEAPHWGAAKALESRGVAGSALVPPDSGRRQDYQASMTLRVADLDALTDRTNEAMRIARSHGGYVASVQQSTPAGKPGQADIVLRVPIGRVEPALVQLSELGTVLDRQLSIVDLEAALRQQQARLVRLKVFIARAVEQLKADLPADVRLRLQLQLQDARASLASATRAHQATLDEAAFSRVALTFTTQQAAAVAQNGPGRFERVARDAGSFLADAGAVLLFVLIVVSPLVVVAVGWRAYRRREERRLLAA